MLMRDESIRLETFTIQENHKYVSDYIYPNELANAGFFYLRFDIIQCAFCRGKISGWKNGEKALAKHSLNFPLCPFIMEEDVGNIPINEDPILGRLSRDVCGNMSSDISRVYKYEAPKNPHYSTYESRLESFKYCITSCISIEKLADAGFYSINKEDDSTRCFHCDGIVLHWEYYDEPWIEHAKHFPDCHYVISNKVIVDECIQKKKRHFILGFDNHIGYYEDDVWETEYENPLVSDGRIINNWKRRGCVREIIDLKLFPEERITAVLMTRYMEEQKEFESFEEFYNAIELEMKSLLTKSHDTVAPMLIEGTDANNILLCKICLNNEIGVVFLPCGHQMTCPSCAQSRPFKHCPVCRQRIFKYIRTFFS